MSNLKERLLQLLAEHPGASTNELHAIIHEVHRTTLYNALMGLFEGGLLQRERIASRYQWSIVTSQADETGVGYLARLYAPKFEKLTVVDTRHFQEKHSAPGAKSTGGRASTLGGAEYALRSRTQHGRHGGHG